MLLFFYLMCLMLFSVEAMQILVDNLPHHTKTGRPLQKVGLSQTCLSNGIYHLCTQGNSLLADIPSKIYPRYLT